MSVRNFAEYFKSSSADTDASTDEDAIQRLDSIQKIRFGNSDMMVSECCIGTMTWGSFNAAPEEAYAQLDKAIELGANCARTPHVNLNHLPSC